MARRVVLWSEGSGSFICHSQETVEDEISSQTICPGCSSFSHKTLDTQQSLFSVSARPRASFNKHCKDHLRKSQSIHGHFLHCARNNVKNNG